MEGENINNLNLDNLPVIKLTVGMDLIFEKKCLSEIEGFFFNLWCSLIIKLRRFVHYNSPGDTPEHTMRHAMRKLIYKYRSTGRVKEIKQ